MRGNILGTFWHWTTDAHGKPLALRVYRNRTYRYFYHEELGKA